VPTPNIFTVGHSTRSLDELVVLLKQNHVELLVDVRTVPASRRMPHFARAALERSLPERGIAYEHMPALGGLRKPRSDSTNLAWRNVSFRGYADYMQTDEFWAALETLLSHIAPPSAAPTPPHKWGGQGHLPMNGEDIALMCAEAVPWRCHRSLIADALTVMGFEVRHITGPGEPPPHHLTPSARVEDGRISYPAPDTLAL
jgi:uncharacterized protein (DUF488 family)